MNTEDFVSYPIALALKKAGFDWPCDHIYLRTKEITDKHAKTYNYEFADWKVDDKDYNKRSRPQLAISAPTLWQAQKWLREKWDWHIDVSPAADCSFDADGQVYEEWNYWAFDITCIISTRKIVESWEQYDSYEAALSAGIAAALELISINHKTTS